jgi:hypothetical protein
VVNRSHPWRVCVKFSGLEINIIAFVWAWHEVTTTGNSNL